MGINTPRATGMVSRYNLPLNESLVQAFTQAWDNFVRDHERQPEIDLCSFRGAFTTTDVVFEIDEDA